MLQDYTPTVDRPFFNIYSWSHFNDAASYSTNGRFVPDEFQFFPGGPPLSKFSHVLVGIATYYLSVFGGRYMSRNTRPFKSNTLFQCHNLFSTSFSFLSSTLMVEQSVPSLIRHGLYDTLCSKYAWTQPSMTLYYLNYSTKFVEFIDTLFSVVKHKNLTFLHTYHHGATALLCYIQSVGHTTIAWVPITLNLGVHVVMYWYYFSAARGIRVWWKEWVTRFQIIQFILDVGFIYFAAYQKTAYRFYPSWPHCGDCVGTLTSNYSGCAIISSYLFLFIAFYIEVYKRSGTKKPVTTNKKKN